MLHKDKNYLYNFFFDIFVVKFFVIFCVFEQVSLKKSDYAIESLKINGYDKEKR